MAQHATRDGDEADLDAYLALFRPYAAQLADFKGRERDYGGRFALLFRQVVRRLAIDSELNARLPQVYRRVAQSYLARDAETVRHFSYEDNRHFFLGELREWITVHERGRRLRQPAQRETDP